MHKSLVGPLGFPFGFTNKGSFNLTVSGFTLSFIEKSKHQHDPDDEDTDLRHHDRRRQLSSTEEEDDDDYSKIKAVGFLLRKFKDEAAFHHYMNELESDGKLCAFTPFLDEEGTTGQDSAAPPEDNTGIIVDTVSGSGMFISVMGAKEKKGPYTISATHQFAKGEEGMYFLLFQVCPPPGDKYIHTSFELDFHFSNYDMLGNKSYLSAGEMPLPHMFFYYSLVYAICIYLWVSNIRSITAGESDGEGGGGRLQTIQELRLPVVFPIHHLMTMLATLKFLSLFFESIRYHFLRVTGHAYFWSGVYYMFAFLKGTFLFTVILLLGSGWSFVKPFLGERERTMACVVLGLQVINNIAIVVLTQRTEGETSFDRWTAVLHMVDILCCCAVLIPIVWHVNTLEKNLELSANHNDADEVVDLQGDTRVPEDEYEESVVEHADSRLASKLKLFRSFYILVVAYIYSTRIVVYLFATMLDYRHTWMRHFVVEAFTLAFYITAGMQFRPMYENPYLTVRQDESSSTSTGDVELAAKPRKNND